MDCITIKIPQGSSSEARDKYKQLLWTEYNSRVEVTHIFFKCKNNQKKKRIRLIKKYLNMMA